MKARNELFDLVHSLSKSEKRYIKLCAESGSGERIYVQLFDAIEKTKVNNERHFKKRFEGSVFLKNYAFNKNYLYAFIIKCLVNYNNEKSIDSKIHFMIMQCKILFNKELYRQYFKSIEKVKKFSLKHERYGYYLQVLDMEKIIIKKEEIQSGKSEKIYIEATEAIRHMKNLFQYSLTSGRLLSYYRRHGIQREEGSDVFIQKIIKNKLISKPLISLTPKERDSYYRIMELINDIKGNYSGMLEAQSQRLKIIQDNPEPFKDNIINYYHDVLSSTIDSSLRLNRLNDALKYINLYKKEKFTNNPELGDFEIITVLSEFLLNVKSSEYEKAGKHIPRLENILLKYEGKILIDTELTIRYNIVKFFILKKDFEQARQSLNALVIHPYINKRTDYESYLKILNLIIHFELGNYELLKYLIISTYRYLRKRKKIYRLEQLIIEFIRKLAVIESEEDLKFEFRQLMKKMETISKDQYEKNAFEYFNFIEWVEGKLK